MQTDTGQQLYIIELKRILKREYFLEINDAIDKKDKDEVKRLLYKYLKKREADQIYPKVVKQMDGWSWEKIQRYLMDELLTEEYKMIFDVIKNGNVDLCQSLIQEYLRFDQAEEIMPHIRNLLLCQNQPESNPKFSKEEILKYIEEKISQKNFQEILKLLKNGYVEDATIYLRTLLKKRQAEFINPKIKQTFADRVKQMKQGQLPKGSKTRILNAYHDKKGMINEQMLRKNNQNSDQIEQVRSKIFQFQDRKIDLIKKELQKLFEGYEEDYKELQNLIDSQKVSKAVQIIQEVLGKKPAQRFKEMLQEQIQQKKNTVAHNAIWLKDLPDGLKIYELQTQEMLDIPQNQICNVLVVGMTGVGKSTFLNSLVNELMGVDMEDNFRYVIITDSLETKFSSSTQKVTIYGIPKQGRMKKAIRLIDAPGLGDTGGIQQDKKNIQKIKDKIESSIPYLHLIIYVFKSSETRVTDESRYVMEQVMGLFARNLATNILFVLTFADFKEPNVKGSLEENFPQIIEKVQTKFDKWYIKVNNSAMFQKINMNETIDRSYYQMGSQCLKATIERIYSSELVKTEMSLSVIKKREDILATLEAFDDLIMSSLNKQRQIKRIAEQVTLKMENMNNVDFIVQYDKEIIIQNKTDKNVTSCLNCKFSCHKNCSRSNNIDKQQCCAMVDGKCKVCPDNCSWRSHENAHYIYVRKTIKYKETNDDLLKRYNIEKSGKQANEELLINLISDYVEMGTKIQLFCARMKEEAEELQKIELRKVTPCSVIKYIEVLISNEKALMREGYQKRIEELILIQKQQKRMEQVFSQNEQEQIKNFADMMETKIKSLIPNKQIAGKMSKKVIQIYESYKNNILNPEDIPEDDDKDEQGTSLPADD